MIQTNASFPQFNISGLSRCPGIANGITEAFQDCAISEKLQIIIFFESDETAVNSGVRAGVKHLLQQKYGEHIVLLVLIIPPGACNEGYT